MCHTYSTDACLENARRMLIRNSFCTRNFFKALRVTISYPDELFSSGIKNLTYKIVRSRNTSQFNELKTNKQTKPQDKQPDPFLDLEEETVRL